MEPLEEAEGRQTPSRAAKAAPQALAGTKLKIAEAALRTLTEKGFAGASAREVARAGGFNQALIFYHFGSVQKALLASLDLVSARRMCAYQPAFEQAHTLAELAGLARTIYAEDLENGYITVLGEMVAGGVSDATLGVEVVARLQPWIDLVEGKVRELLAGSLFESMVSPQDVAFAIVALYLGVDMLAHLERDQARSASLLDLAERYAPFVGTMLPSQRGGGSR